jgi:hypothetical protein
MTKLVRRKMLLNADQRIERVEARLPRFTNRVKSRKVKVTQTLLLVT